MTIAFRNAASTQLPLHRPVTGTAVALDIYDDVKAARPAWSELSVQDCVGSPYQGRDWVTLWDRHVSGPLGEAPLIVVGRAASGSPVFVWPFVIRRLHGLRAGCLFGGKHAPLNMTLWRRDAAPSFSAATMREALRELAGRRPALDLLYLHNQPAAWNGMPNPFLTLPHQLAGEDNFVLHIRSSAERILEQEISATMRGRLRNKERKLAKLPGYRYRRAVTAEDVERQLAAFFAQKAEKLRAMGVENVFAQPGVADFIRAACHEGLADGRPLIELHALEADGEMLALFSGLHDLSRFTSMFNSHTASEHSRQSPGLILLQHLVVDCAARGFGSFDIGPGEARYKSFFCKDVEPVYDSILPLSIKGRIAAPALRAAYRAKASIKRSPRLWEIAQKIRAARNALRTSD